MAYAGWNPGWRTPPPRWRGGVRCGTSPTDLDGLECDEGGLPGGTLQRVYQGASSRRPVVMLHAGVDLSRNRLDVCLLSEHAEVVEEFAAPADADGLRGLARRVGVLGMPVRGVIESMTGARFVHDRLEQLGWLRDGAERISTLDLVGPELTRFTGPDGAADRPTPDPLYERAPVAG